MEQMAASVAQALQEGVRDRILYTGYGQATVDEPCRARTAGTISGDEPKLERLLQLLASLTGRSTYIRSGRSLEGHDWRGICPLFHSIRFDGSVPSQVRHFERGREGLTCV